MMRRVLQKLGYLHDWSVIQSQDNDRLWLRARKHERADAGCSVGPIDDSGLRQGFCEKASGATIERPALRRLLNRLRCNDVLLVTRLDRLARSTRDLLNTITTISKKGAALRSLADPWADTATPHGRLMLAILGGLAEFERDLIRARTADGRARAQAQGVKLGRRPKLTPIQRTEALARREQAKRRLKSPDHTMSVILRYRG